MIYDCTDSNVNWNASSLLFENGIVFIGLSAHAIHVFKPLDTSVSSICRHLIVQKLFNWILFQGWCCYSPTQYFHYVRFYLLSIIPHFTIWHFDGKPLWLFHQQSSHRASLSLSLFYEIDMQKMLILLNAKQFFKNKQYGRRHDADDDKLKLFVFSLAIETHLAKIVFKPSKKTLK